MFFTLLLDDLLPDTQRTKWCLNFIVSPLCAPSFSSLLPFFVHFILFVHCSVSYSVTSAKFQQQRAKIKFEEKRNVFVHNVQCICCDCFWGTHIFRHNNTTKYFTQQNNETIQRDKKTEKKRLKKCVWLHETKPVASFIYFTKSHFVFDRNIFSVRTVPNALIEATNQKWQANE